MLGMRDIGLADDGFTGQVRIDLVAETVGSELAVERREVLVDRDRLSVPIPRQMLAQPTVGAAVLHEGRERSKLRVANQRVLAGCILVATDLDPRSAVSHLGRCVDIAQLRGDATEAAVMISDPPD